jgi:protein-L-isoaspartate(D-aspartate) O-methyltransferase
MDMIIEILDFRLRISNLVLTAIVYSLVFTSLVHAQDDDFQEERLRMVETQIEARGISNPLVLKAMQKVPRHEFVPSSLQRMAYADHPLPIGKDQTISQPYIVALMTESVGLKRHDRVLEIGTGSGYQAAILGEIAKEVYTIEIIASLADSAEENLKKLGYKNISVKTGDGYQGWPEHAPFNAILVTAAPDHIPEPLKEQLAEGGRMVIPVADSYPQRLLLLEKKEGQLKESYITGVMFVPMTGEAEKR